MSGHFTEESGAAPDPRPAARRTCDRTRVAINLEPVRNETECQECPARYACNACAPRHGSEWEALKTILKRRRKPHPFQH